MEIDGIELNDSVGTASVFTYTITASEITAGGTFAISAIDNVTVTGNSGFNNMTVSDTLPNMFLNVNGLGGNDTFTVGGRDFDEGNFFAGNTTLNGGGGDRLDHLRRPRR